MNRPIDQQINESTSRLSMNSESLISYILIAIAFIVPVLVCPWTFDFYNLPKIIFLHTATLIMLLIWFNRIIRDNGFIYHHTSMDLPLLFFALTIIFSTIFSINPLISIFGQYRRFEGLPALLNYIILFYLAFYFFNEEKQIKRLATSFVAASFLVSVYGIAQYFGFEFLRVAAQPFGVRIFSSLGNPVFLAAFLAMTIPITVVLLLYTKVSLQRLFLVISLSAELICLFLTYSRGGWLGFLAGTAFLIIFAGRGSLRRHGKFVAVVCIALMLVLMSTFFIGFSKGEIPSSEFSRIASSFALKEGTIGTRLSIWGSTVRMTADRPFLGYGPETFRTAFPPYRSLTFIRLESEKAMPDRAHNDFLHIGASTGLLGLAFYFWALIAFSLSAGVLLKRVRGSNIYPLLVGFLAACVAYVVQIQFEPSMVGVAPLFWLLMGSVMAFGNFSKFKVWETGRFSFPSSRVFKTFTTILLGVFLIVFLSVSFYFGTIVAADIQLYNGLCSNSSGNVNEAIFGLEKSVVLNPHHNIQRFYLGGAYLRKAKITNNPLWADKAISVYRDALEFNDLDEDIYLNLGDALSYYGFTWRDNNKLALAEAAYKKAIEIDGYFSAAHQRLGALYRIKGFCDGAISEEKKAIFTDPSNFSAYYELGLAYEEKREAQKAIESYEKVLEIEPDFKKAREKLEHLKKKL